MLAVWHKYVIQPERATFALTIGIVFPISLRWSWLNWVCGSFCFENSRLGAHREGVIVRFSRARIENAVIKSVVERKKRPSLQFEYSLLILTCCLSLRVLCKLAPVSSLHLWFYGLGGICSAVYICICLLSTSDINCVEFKENVSCNDLFLRIRCSTFFVF